MINQMEIDPKQLQETQELFNELEKKIPTELANAVNKTSRTTRTKVDKRIREEIAITKKDVKKFLKITGRATSRNPSTSVRLDYEKRPGIGGKTNRFKPRQTAKGTSFKVGKKTRRKTIKGAFMGPRPGKLAPKLHGGVFKRQGRGRTPIQKLHGASPWGAYMKRRMDPVIRRFAKEELERQTAMRIDLLLKKHE